MNLKSQSGFSLIQVIVSIGVMAAMIAGTTQMFVSQSREIARLTLKQEVQAHISELQTVLTDQTACRNALIGSVPTLQTSDFTSGPPARRDVQMVVGAKTYAPGQDIADLRVQSMHLTQSSESTMPNGDILHLVNLFIRFGLKPTDGRNIAFAESFVSAFYILTDSSGAFAGCVSGVGTGLGSFTGSAAGTGSIWDWAPVPPRCVGATRALQWDGSGWNCRTLSFPSLRACRVCIQLASNSSRDGAVRCSSYSSANAYVGTGFSRWAEAGPGANGGGKYAARAWIQCY